MWPSPGTVPKIKLADVPNGAHILGMAPIGVRWEGTMRNGVVCPDKGCPKGEFSPCYALLPDGWKEIECPKT